MTTSSKELKELALLLEPVEAEVSAAENEVVALEQQHAAAVTRLNEAQKKQSEILEQVYALSRADDRNISSRPQMDAAIDMQELLATPLHSLPLPTRVVNALEAEKIYFLGDLVQRNMSSLSKMLGIGKMARDLITAVVESRELSLDMNIKDLWQRPIGYLPKK